MPHRPLTRVTPFARTVWTLIAALVLAADQVTKAMVQDRIPEHATIPIIPHFLNLIHAENTGAAFGLFSDSPARWKTAVLVVLSGALLAAVGVLLWRNRQLRWGTGVAFALIFGGALSNLFDRIRNGRVVDFLDVYYRGYHWPTFNLADSAIVVGAALLALHLLFLE